MANPPGLRVNGRFYPIPDSLRIGETRTIKQITGLTPPEFQKAIGELSKTQDPDVSTALLWWVMHREDPSVKVDDLDELEWTDIKSEGDEAEKPDPKAVGGPDGSSLPPAEKLNGTADENSVPTPLISGVPG